MVALWVGGRVDFTLEALVSEVDLRRLLLRLCHSLICLENLVLDWFLRGNNYLRFVVIDFR